MEYNLNIMEQAVERAKLLMNNARLVHLRATTDLAQKTEDYSYLVKLLAEATAHNSRREKRKYPKKKGWGSF